MKEKEMEIPGRARIYVASKYAGDVEKNAADAIRYCRHVIGLGRIPVASHLLYPQMLDDGDPEERLLGTAFGFSLIGYCEELWVFGEVSHGVKREIEEAERTGKKVRYFGTDCKELEGENHGK